MVPMVRVYLSNPTRGAARDLGEQPNPGRPVAHPLGSQETLQTQHTWAGRRGGSPERSTAPRKAGSRTSRSDATVSVAHRFVTYPASDERKHVMPARPFLVRRSRLGSWSDEWSDDPYYRHRPSGATTATRRSVLPTEPRLASP